MKKASIFYTILILIVIVAGWFGTGFYTIKSDGGEQALIMRFGQFIRIEVEAGLKWHLPAPIETVEIVKADVLRSMEVGFRTVQAGTTTSSGTYESVPAETLMITGDENLVNTETVIQYRITDIAKFQFNVDMPLETLKIAAESSIRRVVANHTLNDVLTDQKDVIQMEVRDDLQAICDNYGMGVQISKVALQSVYAPVEVSEAFDDVIKAREDKNRFINDARKSANEIVPAAEGKKQEIINEANAYKEKRIAEARGDVENFKQVLQKYMLGKEVTRTRMYLETMEDVLTGAKIYIMNENSDVLKLLPIGEQ